MGGYCPANRYGSVMVEVVTICIKRLLVTRGEPRVLKQHEGGARTGGVFLQEPFAFLESTVFLYISILLLLSKHPMFV
jgi:hypothetical protein